MNKKGWSVFKILLGCYLIFLGAGLIFQVNRENPTDKNLMTVFAVLFILIGAVYALIAIKDAAGFTFHRSGGGLFRSKKKEAADDATVEIRLDGQIKKDKILEKVQLTSMSPAAESPAQSESEKEEKNGSYDPETDEQDTEKQEPQDQARETEQEQEEPAKSGGQEETEDIENDYEEK